MTKHITDEDGGSFIANAWTNKLNNIWQHLKSKSNDLACCFDCVLPLRYMFRSITTEAELFALISSIFPDGFGISVEDLVVYGMGLGLFEDVHDMFAARYRVHDIISIINGQEYLHKVGGGKIKLAYEKEGPRNQYVKMLVGPRSLTKSIASSNPLIFRREIVIEKWSESDWYKDCYGLSLVLKKVLEHSIHLECPKLTLLQLQYQEDSLSIPIDFFEDMKELRVLSLDVPSLPQSINVLRNLKTLRLKVSKCEDMFLIGGLINLEFLSIFVLSLTDIPLEMGQLEKLRLLDLRKMNIANIPPGVLSKLLKLEELYLPLSFNRWGCKAKKYDGYDEWESREEDNYDDEERINANISEIDDGERINASLSEIVPLSLSALQISVPKASILPKKSPIFKNIQEFKIHMPNNVKYEPFGKDSINELQLTGEACDIKESGICDLMSRTEHLSLIRVRNLKNVIYQLDDHDFSQLKKMIISECDELEYVIDTTKKHYLFKKLECLHLSILSNLKEICHQKLTFFGCLPNLSHVSIRFCHKLKYVFALSIVRGSFLKSIEILDCDEMEGIFYEDEENDIPFRLCSIEKLDLHSLPRLISLLVHKDDTINGVHDDTNEPLATDKVSVIKNKDVNGHMKMYSAFPSKLAKKWSQNLKRLKVAFCDAIQVVFLFEENHGTTKAFNSLQDLELHGLRNLVHVCFHTPPQIIAFQNLQLLVLSECCNSYLFSYQVAKLLVQLQKIYISRCGKIEEIVKVDDNEVKDKILFPRLKLLELQHIPNLSIFFDVVYEIELPLLESLKINQCNKMKHFSYGLLWAPMLERIELNGSLYSLMGDLNATIIREANQSFSYGDLKAATDNFRSDNFLGDGGYGRVYKGWIDEKTFAPSKLGIGMPVAIKILNSESQKLFMDWRSDMDFLERLSHPNVVKLFGYYFGDRKLFLVYEFMQRGNLENHLFIRNSLSWDMRIKIAIGAARGLDFLHTSENKVIHRNIKSSAILIDDNYNAKIHDFGLAMLGPSDGDSHVTTMITGTYGYAAPEYVATGHLYVKSDVYSFGVVLLELMTGLRVIDERRPTGQQNLVDWLKPILSQKTNLQNIIDPRIKGQYSSEAMLIASQLSLKCLEPDPKSRPSMKEVVDTLQQISTIKGKTRTLVG